MPISRDSESQAFADVIFGQKLPVQSDPSYELMSRNEAMNSNTAAPITTPSPLVRERMFT